MKYSFHYFLLVLILLPACWAKKEHTAPDEIIETMHITDIYKYINPDEYNNNTLVMFDIDNTIVTSQTDLGSDQWFDAMYEKKMAEKNIDTNQAIQEILPTYKQVLMKTIYLPVEPETVSVIKNLQEKGVMVIGLTARSLDLAYRTAEQLHDVDIHFDNTTHHECPIKYGDDKPALYLDGIIFSGNYNKGEVLVSWLKQVHYTPKKVIFIDDKLKNVRSVEQALHKRDFPFYGLRYGFLDEHRKNFDWNTTQKELEL